MSKPYEERLILRTEYDPYMEMEKVLACFPDDPANPGRICAVPMYFRFDNAWFEPYTEVALGYYYCSTKPLRNKELAEKCKAALEARYSTKEEPVQFKIVQKITVRR